MQKNIRILLLEDEDILRRITSQMLEHLGCSVVATTKGEDTISAYTSAMDDAPFDLVILDLTIDSGMGGEDTATAILELDSQAHLVISSGFGNNPLITDFHDYGFKAVLKKPYQVQDLNAIINPFLTQSTTGV